MSIDSPASATRASTESLNAPGAELTDRYQSIRRFTTSLCEPLETEDYVVQTMENVSPTKWHLAHTTWFFETFVLEEYADDYVPLNEQYAYLFNSYYVQAGERHCRDKRGYISRPTVKQVMEYRRYVDEHVMELLVTADAARLAEIEPVVEIGMHHEQQHQELMLTDIKHVLSVNPLRPVYRAPAGSTADESTPQEWIDFEGGLVEIGHDDPGFCYDNEEPRHKRYLEPFQLSNRLVTNGEFMEFIDDGGYQKAPLWLSDGWATVQEEEWTEPFYWEKIDGDWHLYTLGGMRKVDPQAPLCHVSYYEADAFARWAGARLPTEAEWEVAARDVPISGNFVEEETYHPQRATGPADGSLKQMYGDVWEWTRSHYSPYPGYEPLPGAIGEYNGKFMANQFVLRGGSCATSRSHIRPTYRNFFHPDTCWQFVGLRLARDAQQTG